MVAAFDWLVSESKENDIAVLYFSGHGDVETKTRANLGFLLSWDSPSNSYMARAFSVYYLQQLEKLMNSMCL
ncbi:MAG: caspase family protein [Saprospiraceae bacterium]|nr:caspase family protein [Saprospiraceae bacterium]MCF8251540.1 caspase family protein [Saprospiraceae bacterium]MCF8280870.1 caspase family protein [Bacteroidales bacterium]MCF8310950.1 caspase family protein [Saprospiraceae bacterium]MCF8439714.1 caspase family protein [Saprospiraceae bacterium]